MTETYYVLRLLNNYWMLHRSVAVIVHNRTYNKHKKMYKIKYIKEHKSLETSVSFNWM